MLSNGSEHLGNPSEGMTQACCDEGGRKLVHPQKSVLSSQRTWGGIQREVTEGSEGQVLSKLCFLLPGKILLLALKLTHHGILNIHYVYTELKGQKVVFCFN